MSNVVLCAKASILLQNVHAAVLLIFLREHRSEWEDSSIDAYSASVVKAGPFSLPGAQFGNFGGHVILPLAHTVEHEESLEVIKLENGGQCQEDSIMAKDLFLLQCSKKLGLRLEVGLIDVDVMISTTDLAQHTLEQVQDYRIDWDLQVNQHITGNYYHINHGIYLEDDKIGFSVLVDRSVGGSSLIYGQVELMLHRRLVHDDSRGVAEALNEIVCVANEFMGLIVSTPCLVLVDKHFSILSRCAINTQFLHASLSE